MLELEPPPAQPRQDANPHMPGLDGVRGLAVLLVLLDHAGDFRMQLFPGADLNHIGKYGVYLFFVLSAFLLTHQFSLRRDEEFLRAHTWLNYTLRRFLRIFPPYAVVLVAYVFMHKMHWGEVASHLSLREGSGQFWTIPVEVKYYALLPFVAFAVFGAGRRHWLLGAAAGVVAGVAAWALFGFERWWSLRPAVFLSSNLAPFLMGSALALIHGALRRTPALRQRLAVWLEIGAIAAVMLLAVRLPQFHVSLFSSKSLLGRHLDPEVCGVLWSLFLLGVLFGKGWLRRGMEWPPLRSLGMISFSVYLWHKRFLSDVDDLPAPSPIRLLVYLAIVLAVSTVSYWLIERPLARVRWNPRRRETSAIPVVVESCDACES